RWRTSSPGTPSITAPSCAAGCNNDEDDVWSPHSPERGSAAGENERGGHPLRSARPQDEAPIEEPHASSVLASTDIVNGPGRRLNRSRKLMLALVGRLSPPRSMTTKGLLRLFRPTKPEAPRSVTFLRRPRSTTKSRPSRGCCPRLVKVSVSV